MRSGIGGSGEPRIREVVHGSRLDADVSAHNVIANTHTIDHALKDSLGAISAQNSTETAGAEQSRRRTKPNSPRQGASS